MHKPPPSAAREAGWSAGYKFESGWLSMFQPRSPATADPQSGLHRVLSIKECGVEADIARYCSLGEVVTSTTLKSDTPRSRTVRKQYGICLKWTIDVIVYSSLLSVHCIAQYLDRDMTGTNQLWRIVYALSYGRTEFEPSTCICKLPRERRAPVCNFGYRFCYDAPLLRTSGFAFLMQARAQQLMLSRFRIFSRPAGQAL
jgi:hypothetical protein